MRAGGRAVAAGVLVTNLRPAMLGTEQVTVRAASALAGMSESEIAAAAPRMPPPIRVTG